MSVGRQLIEQNASSPEPYRDYAEWCFRAGRDDQGIDSLRQAMRRAPRDNATRQHLARSLADRFRTDEAIELYWQAFTSETSLDARLDLIPEITRLYQRRGEVQTLVRRVNDREDLSRDDRSRALLVAQVHRSNGNLRAAAKLLAGALAYRPRDTHLLLELVSLSELSGDYDAAIGYQKQVVELSDTPENRSKLMSLSLFTGTVDYVQEMTRLIRDATTRSDVTQLIDRVIGEGDYDVAIQLCEEAIKQRDEMWGIKLRLATLLAIENRLDEATEWVTRIRQLKLNDDVAPPGESRIQSRFTGAGSGPSNTLASPSTTAMPRRATKVVIDQLISSVSFLGQPTRHGFGLTQYSRQLFRVDRYGDARWLLEATEALIAESQGQLEQLIRDRADVNLLMQERDVDALWSAYLVRSLKARLARTTYAYPFFTFGSSPSAEPKSRHLDRILWRIAEVDTEHSDGMLFDRLVSRSPELGTATERPAPLSDQQLDLLWRRSNRSATAGPNATFHWMIYQELVHAGRSDQAQQLRDRCEFEPKSLSDAGQVIGFVTFIRDAKRVWHWINHLHQNVADWVIDADTSTIDKFAQLSPSSQLLDRDAQYQWVDISVAVATKRQSLLPAKPARQVGAIRYALSGGYSVASPSQTQVRANAQAMLQSLSVAVGGSLSSPTWLVIGHRLIHQEGRFEPDHPLASIELMKRRLLAAILAESRDNREAAISQLRSLTNDFPDQPDLKVELAWMTAMSQRSVEALQMLDEMEINDVELLKLREMLAIDVATSINDIDRAKLAARRLFGMKLTAQEGHALAETFVGLGMNEEAAALLNRSRSRGGQTPSQLLQMARQYLDLGKKLEAGEVAYLAYQRCTKSTDQRGSYRATAVGLLRRAGRLDGLVREIETRAASSPNVKSAQQQLAYLYRALGDRKKAALVEKKLAKSASSLRKSIEQQIQATAAAGNYSTARDLLLSALETQPQTIRQDTLYSLMRASRSKLLDASSYGRLAKLDYRHIPIPATEFLVSSLNPKVAKGDRDRFLDRVLTTADRSLLPRILCRIDAATLTRLKSAPSVLAQLIGGDSFYDASNPLLTSGSYQNGGEVVGFVQKLVAVAGRDQELKSLYERELQKRCRSKDRFESLTANLLLAPLLDDSTNGASRECLQAFLDDDSTRVPETLV
ncbi:MAG: tetratricopeptide repeat protein, partial [Planctomycetota bacterium]